MADFDEDFSIIESAQDALQSTNQHGRTIEERICNNYYVEEYMSIDNLNVMKQKAIKNGLRSCRFRSLCWRIFLQCLPEVSNERVAEIRKLRAKYEEIHNKYRQDPRMVKLNDETVIHDNPLSQEETSHWNCYFSDVELQTRIKQDVVRAFPDLNFFQSEKIQLIMTNILFNYARENPQTEYKQGMHEILAPLIFVIHCDHQTYQFAQEKGLVQNEIKELLDQDYLEHDSYFLFIHVMESIDSWYDSKSVQIIKKNEYVNMEPFSNDTDFNCYSKIGIKLQMINEELLHKYDQKLYLHLKELMIPPQIYGIRWMRLLFIREFQMQDLLVVWDAIFANGFGLCDYIFTAMLVVIRSILLPCDYANCLNHLMRYPSVADVHYVIHLALHIRDPLNYPEPVEHSTLVLPNPNAIKVQNANRLPKSASISSLKGGGSNSFLRPKSLHILAGNNNKHSGGNNGARTTTNEMKHMSFEWIEDKLANVHMSGGGGDYHNDYCCSSAKEAEMLKYKIEFCSSYMSRHLDVIQTFINKRNNCSHKSLHEDANDNGNNDKGEIENVLMSIAEMKKIRDMLRGTIAFESSLNK